MIRVTIRTVFVAALLTIAGFTSSRGAVARQGTPVSRAGALDTTIELASFDTAWRRVRDLYYDSTMHGLDWNRVRDQYRPRVVAAHSRDEVRAAIGDMFATLGDSHFGVIPAEQLSSNESGADYSADVGIEVRFIGNDLVITSVDSSGPAAKAGVHAGWIIDEIDTVRVASKVPLMHAAPDAKRHRRDALRVLLGMIHRLEGAPGSTAHLVMRDGRNKRQERNIVRRPAPGTVVKFGDLPAMFADLEYERNGPQTACVGVIRFNVWMPVIAQRVDSAMNALRMCRAIVLDLRGNVGGVAAMITGITGHFTDKELLLGVMRTRTNELRYVANPRRVVSGGVVYEPYAGPLALVVDALSASTTEIFASALQSHGRARVFGDTTAGQALPATLFKLPNGDAMMYVLADLTDPTGRRLEGQGVVPNEERPAKRASLLAGRDEALAAALNWAETDGRGARTPGPR